MIRQRTFLLPIVGAVSTAFLTYGCTPSPARQICVDGANNRLGDSSCRSGGGGGGAHWYYYGSGSRVPGVGERAAGGSFVPSSGVSYSAAPSVGVSRGGFGAIGSGHGAGE